MKMGFMDKVTHLFSPPHETAVMKMSGWRENSNAFLAGKFK